MVTLGDSPGGPAAKNWCPPPLSVLGPPEREGATLTAGLAVPRSATAHLFLRVPSTGPLVHGEACWGCWHRGASRAHGKGDLWLPADQYRTWRPGGPWQGVIYVCWHRASVVPGVSLPDLTLISSPCLTDIE